MKTLIFKTVIGGLVVMLVCFFGIVCGGGGTGSEGSYPYSYLIVANFDTDEINAVNITYEGITLNVIAGFTIGFWEYLLLYDTIEMTLDINITTAAGDNVTYTNQVIPVNMALVIIQEQNVFTKELMSAADAEYEGFDLSLAGKSEEKSAVSLLKSIGIRKMNK